MSKKRDEKSKKTNVVDCNKSSVKSTTDTECCSKTDNMKDCK